MATSTYQIWILHRDAAKRAALERLIGAGTAGLANSPTDAALASAGAPRVVVLGLAGDIELELEFVHRNAARLAGCRWILASADRGEAELRGLFDTVDARVLLAPHSAGQLRSAIREALSSVVTRDSLSLRRYRDKLSERFVRWFDDLGVNELLRAMDPKLARVPLIVRGEPGTGRALFARYVHTFGGDTAGGSMPFVELDCAAARDEADLLRPIAQTAGAPSGTVLLDRLDELPGPLRARLLQWIEFGLPPRVAPGTRLRWVASLPPLHTARPDHGEDPALLAALAGLVVSIPPLRERAQAIPSFVEATVREWSHTAGRRPRAIAPDAAEELALYTWPGNCRELESVVVRALAEFSADPLEARHLRIDPDAEPLGLESEEPEQTQQPIGPGPEPVRPLPTPVTQELPAAELLEEEPPLIELRPEDVIEERQDSAPRVGDASPLPGGADDPRGWQNLLGSVSGELREAVERIRKLTDQLPEHLDDPDFRARFRELLGADVRNLDGIGKRLGALGRPGQRECEPFDATALIESLLDELRGELLRRNLVVLKELDRRHPEAIANAADLRLALQGLLENLVLRSREDGDLYVASHHNPVGLRGAPAMRILVRHIPGEPSHSGLSPQLELELAMCQQVTETAGGCFTLSDGPGEELVIVLDLPAPIGAD